MKANRKSVFEADEDAVSAVIGVILMIAITVALAGVVYSLLSNFFATDDDVVVCGKISELPSKYGAGILKMDGQIFIIKDTGDTEYMLMQYAYSHNCNCTLILYDSLDANIYWVRGGSVSLLDCGCDN